MQKIKLFVFLFAIGFLAPTLQAQDYKTALGLRLGYPVSLSFKTFAGGGSNAVEAFVNYRSRNVFESFGWTRIGVGAAYQVHNELSDVADGLAWYYGAGASVYFWSYDNYFGFEGESSVSLGIQGYLGLDYKFENIPLNVSLDWVPTYFINGYLNGFGADSGALSVRYVLK